MKKAGTVLMILTGAAFLSACGPHHHHVVKPKSLVVVPHVKQVVVVKPLKAKQVH